MGEGADSAADNPRVLTEADRAWPLYRDAVSSVLGEPAWEGAWDSTSFPEELGEDEIPGVEDRLEDKTPYHIAYWEPAAPDGPLTSLTITPATGTVDGSRIGVATMSLRTYPRPLKAGRP